MQVRLDAALPDGIDVIEVADLAVVQAPRLEASEWEVVLPGVAPAEAIMVIEAFLAAPHAEVERITTLLPSAISMKMDFSPELDIDMAAVAAFRG